MYISWYFTLKGSAPIEVTYNHIAFFKRRTTIVLSVRVCLDLSVGPLCVKVCCVADEVPVNVLLLD